LKKEKSVVFGVVIAFARGFLSGGASMDLELPWITLLGLLKRIAVDMSRMAITRESCCGPPQRKSRQWLIAGFVFEVRVKITLH
jgi:hypothetical protein